MNNIFSLSFLEYSFLEITQEYAHVTPLNALQQKIIQLLELLPDIYASLESSPAES